MYVPITDSNNEGYRLLSGLAAFMVNGLIFSVGIEMIFFWSSLGTGFTAPILTGVIDTPVFVPFAILLCIHPIFMLPSLIGSFFYRKTNSKGFFVLSLLLNILNLIYEIFMIAFYALPWTLQYYGVFFK